MTSAERIEQAAAEWLMRREEGGWSDADQAALASWLDQSFAHKAALWRLEHGWRRADRIGALGLAEPAPEPAPLPRRRWMHAGLGALAASLIVAVAVGAFWLTRPTAQTFPVARFDTPVGGHRLIALGDGSRIELNTATRLRTAVSDTRREVWLDHGEAYFEVAHIDGRSFVVHAGQRTVTVLGTKFSVRRDGNVVRVSVVEGRVRIEDSGRGEAGAVTTVTRGDVALARGPSTLVSAKSIDRVEDGLAWREGMLTFDQITLGDAAAEFNRYNLRKLIIADPAVASIRIGGTFEARNVDAFARLLKDAYGLRLTAREGELVITG
jgi:transmembrane sensor